MQPHAEGRIWSRPSESLPRQTGVDEIRLPGERAARTEAARRKSGIPIPGKLWEELRASPPNFMPDS